MFFFAFFWAFFASSLTPPTEIGNIWPPKGINTFNALEVPLVNTLILLSSGASVTYAHHAIAAGLKTDAVFGLILTVFLAFIFTISCSKDDPDAVNEQEFISNVILTIESADGTSQTVDWDLSEMNSQTINLKVNTDHNVGIRFINSSDPNDIEDLTLEVIAEADEHQVFYEFADVSVNVTSASNDTKDGGRGVLLNSVWNASSIGTGLVRVYLIHEPTNFNATTRDGLGGNNDVAIDIPVSIVE